MLRSSYSATFYGTRSFLTIFTKTRHFSLSSFRSTQSTASHPLPLRSIWISPSHLGIGLPNVLIPSGFPAHFCIHIFFPPTRYSLHPPIWWWVQIVKLIVKFPPVCCCFLLLTPKYVRQHRIMKLPKPLPFQTLLLFISKTDFSTQQSSQKLEGKTDKAEWIVQITVSDVGH